MHPCLPDWLPDYLTACLPAVPYELPAEVATAIDSIRAVAAGEPAPPPPPAAAEEGGKKQRRVLPKAIKDALAAFSPLYLQQTEAHGQVGLPVSQPAVHMFALFPAAPSRP